MKRKQLLRKLNKIARQYGHRLDTGKPTRGHGPHDIWIVGPARAVVPRHDEIKENTARRILQLFEHDLRDPPTSEEQK